MHSQPSGPGDARPTAMQVVQDERLQGQLNGRVAVVTGGTAGIGLALCKALHATGMHLTLGAVSHKEAEAALISIQGTETAEPSTVTCVPLDLASLQSVRSFADSIKRQHKHVHLLVNNAGARNRAFAVFAVAASVKRCCGPAHPAVP
jgi:NAD(P)-dependent dehydrogenase (short-subunit alcohol dehydrogenase family)